MTQSKNKPKLDSGLNWYYFDVFFNNYNHSAPAYISTVYISPPISSVIKIVSIIKFDSSEIVE